MEKRILPEDSTTGAGEVVLSQAGIAHALQNLKERLAQEDRVLFAYVHGSFLSDLPSHDLDVAVYFTEGLSSREKLDTCLGLESKLERILGIPMDVHAIDPENLAFSFDALSGKLLFSRDEEKRERFEERTIALFMDYKPMLKQILQDLAER